MITPAPPTRTAALSIPLASVLAGLLAGFLAGQAIEREAAQEPTHTIRVGTWNLEQLGFRDPRRTPDDYRKLAVFIRRMGVSVLAVQEVNGAEPLEHLVEHLGREWRFVVGESGGFRGQNTRISVGFLWNKRKVRLRQCEEMIDFPRRSNDLPIFHRLPVCAVFTAYGPDGKVGLDFRIVTVHLKASRGQKNEDKRVAEVKQLKKFLDKLTKSPREDQDILIVGDFNHTYGAPAHLEFTSERSIRYLRGKVDKPTIVHFDHPIDQIAVTRGIEEEIIKGSYRVHAQMLDVTGLRGATRQAALAKKKKDWRASYSDHLPVTIDLDASRDRDPDAWFRAPAHPLAPGRKPTSETQKSPFVAGTNVWVKLRRDPQGAGLRGRLLAVPDRWLQLRLGDGRQRAYPIDEVLYIEVIR